MARRRPPRHDPPDPDQMGLRFNAEQSEQRRRLDAWRKAFGGDPVREADAFKASLWHLDARDVRPAAYWLARHCQPWRAVRHLVPWQTIATFFAVMRERGLASQADRGFLDAETGDNLPDVAG